MQDSETLQEINVYDISAGFQILILKHLDRNRSGLIEIKTNREREKRF